MTLKKKKRFQSIGSVLSANFLAFSLFVLVITNGIGIYFGYLVQQQNLTQQQQLIGKNIALTVEDFISGRISELKDAVRFGALSNTTANSESALYKVLGMDISFRQILILDKNGKMLVHVTRLPTNTPFDISSAERSAMSNQTDKGLSYVSDIYLDSKTNEPLVLVAAPIANVLGEVNGAVIGEVNLKFMWDLVSEVKIGTNGGAYVVDKRGELLAYKDVGLVLQNKNLSYLNEVSHFVSETESATHDVRTQIGITGEVTVATHVPLTFPNWAVVVELPFSEAYAPTIRLFAVSVTIILAAALASSITGAYIARRITKPISDINDAAKMISRGNLDIRLTTVDNNEVGQLAETFNNMAGQVQQSYQAMKKRVDELEQMHRLTVDRELKMIEMKKELKKIEPVK